MAPKDKTKGKSSRRRTRNKKKRTAPEDISSVSASSSSSSSSESSSSSDTRAKKRKRAHQQPEIATKKKSKDETALPQSLHSQPSSEQNSSKKSKVSVIPSRNKSSVQSTHEDAKPDQDHTEDDSVSSPSSPSTPDAKDQNEQQPKPTESQTQRQTTDAAFEDWYVRAVTAQYGNDLDKLRNEAADFKARPREAVAMLSRALRQGAGMFSERDKEGVLSGIGGVR